MKDWDKWTSEKVKADVYYVGQGTAVKISEDNGITWKEALLRSDKTLNSSLELEAPPGFRRFSLESYILQFEDKFVFTSDIWSSL